MCGICGFVDFNTKSNQCDLAKMVETLHHRGPNDRGEELYDAENFIVGLGHTRLSILDLSDAGHQPMSFEDLSIVYNGEIYNFNEIKSDLLKLGHKFKSESDTEVILHAFIQWGICCVSRFIGMFSFVIFDKKTFELTVVRDRAGIKPLYYYWHAGIFLFSSELKAFHVHPQFKKKINDNAVSQFMDFGYVPAPYCIFEHTSKLEPGHCLILNLKNKDLKVHKYWDVKDCYLKPTLDISYEDAIIEVEKLLFSAFNFRMISDVPVGVFLSGGYDSTCVASMIQSDKTNKLRTFSIGFNEGIDEAPFAKAIARYIGTNHTEYYCTSKEAQEIIPILPKYFDEPFADSSAIPTMLVCKKAVQDVTVALSADGGDEIFAGYSTYKSYLNDLNRLNKIPSILHNPVNIFAKFASKILPNNIYLKSKLDVVSEVLSCDEKLIEQTLLRNYPLVRLSRSVRNGLLKKIFPNQPTFYDSDFSNFNDKLSISLAIDYRMYLQNDILTKVDRAAMSVSLESRDPFLDHRIIEFVAQLPNQYKYSRSQKKILKDITHKYVPKELLDRPKAGFSVPIYKWLKNDLIYLVNDNLNSKVIENTNVFNSKYVENLKKRFLNDNLQDPVIIWKIIQFQMWYEKWM